MNQEQSKPKRRRGPKPNPNPAVKRNKRVSVYFNEVEYIELCSRVKKRIELCDYIRAQVFAGKTPYSVTVPELNLQAYSELARAAANLNQISRQLNIDSDPFDFDQLRKELHAFRMALIQGPHQ